jgi:ferritin-like metal-binding protein YciE
MKSNSFHDFYQELLADTYDAEHQLIKALPKLAKAASSDELREGFEEHLEQTREHVSRLEQVFQSHGLKPKRVKCEGMAGLIEEGEEVIEQFEKGELRDAALICAAQKVEHYEIAGYGSLRTFAQLLGEERAVNLLEQTLEEEKETDQRLTKIAEGINPDVVREEGQEEEVETSAKAAPRRSTNSRKRVA